MTSKAKLAAAILLAVFTGRVLGSPSVEVVSVDNTSALTGYLTHDFQATAFDSDWTGAALLLNLSAGSIYQDAFGSNLPPSPSWFELFPTLEFDTYVGVPGSSIAGGAGDVGGDGLTFSTTELDVSFYNINSSDTGTFSIGRVTLSDDAVGTWSLLAVADGDQLFDLVGTITQGVMTVDAEASAAAALARYLNSDEYQRTLPRRIIEREPVDLTSRLTPVLPFPQLDAISPEPGMMALVGLGGLALLRRR